MIGLLSWRIKSRIETALQGLPMFQNLLTKFVDNLPEDVFFVEIGANDGIDFDPIYQAVIKKKWSGVYIEPQKSVFLKLQCNFHGRENIFFENIAITKEEMFVDLFSPNEEITNGNSLIASMHMNKGVLRHFTESELREINASLVEVGYKIYLDKMDTLAILISK